MKCLSMTTWLTSLVLLLTSVGSNAAIELIATESVGDSGNSNSVSIDRPAGVAASDLLLAQISWRGNRNLSSVPSGWTLRQYQSNGSVIRQAIYSKLASASEPASYTWQFSGSGRNAGAISVWRGVDTTAPVHASLGQSGSSSALTAPALSVTEANLTAVALFASANGNSDVDVDAPLSTAYQHETSAGGNGIAIAAGSVLEPASGSIGPYSANAANEEYVATTLALKPALLATVCLPDDFNRTTLGGDWVTTSVSGSFGQPRIVGNRMRITDSSGNVSTAATLQRLFPTTGNLVVIEFRYYAYSSSNASGADGIAVILSDASITPQPGGFGGSLGYAQRSGINGFAGGWVGIGLDEFGNYSNPTEGRSGGPGARADAVAIRGSGSGTSGYRYVAGTASLSPGVDDNSTGSTPAPGHRYRITIDARVAGTVPVTVERDTSGGTNYSTILSVANLLTATGQAALPANLMLSFTGSTGGSVNIHEIDDLGVCAVNMQPLVTVDHFRFITDGEALTCAPETITVQACADSNCSSFVNQNVAVTLTPTGWVGGDSQTLSNGVGLLQLRRTTATATPLALNVLSSSPPLKAFASSPRCFTAGGASISCQIMFRDAGFVFDVPDLTANKPSSDITVRAMRSAAPSGSCVPTWANVSRTVQFFSGYVSPITGSQAMAVNGSNIGGSLASATPLTLNFDNTGAATITVRYPDAGAMQLNARYDGSAANSDTGLLLQGSDQFVVSPAGFCVEAKTLTAPVTTLANCADSSCPLYQRAGQNFPFTVRAMAWEQDGETGTAFCSGNNLTPNFANTVTMNHDMLDSGVDGSFSPSTINLSSGSFTGSGQFSEVGRFSLSTAGTYFGVTLPASASAAIGRIVPDRYVVDVSGYNAHCTSSNAFSYAGLQGQRAGESFALNSTVTAVNAAGVTTSNYHGAYAKLQNGVIAFTDRHAGVAAADGEFVAAGHSLSFTNGVGIPFLTATGAAGTIASNYQFNTTRAPYSVALRADVNDSDGISGSSSEQGPIEFRLGRLLVENAYGPEQLPLPIPLRAEYFDGNNWRRNADDFCSTYVNSQISRDQYTGTLTAALTTPAQPLSTTPLSAGLSQTGAMLQLAAPGLGHYGSLRVTMAVPSWLQFDWNGDGSADLPTATATFGRFRGSDRVLIWREELPAKP